LGAAGIPCGPIHDVGQVCNDAQVVAREMIIELEHPVAGWQKMPNTPLKFSQTPIELQEPAPLLGQHTQQVLGEWLGLSVEELEALRAEGTI
jgi:CoA:oxalate CoA-transferase